MLFLNYLSLYSIKLYVGISTSVSLALSIFALFISLIQSVNGAQFLNTTSLPALIAGAGAATHTTVIVPLTNIYASL